MLVAVDAARVREALVAMIGAVDGFRVVATVASDEQAVRQARRLRPTLALIDQDLPACGGAWAVQTLRDEQLVQAIVAIGLRADGSTRERARAAGARAYVQTGASPDDLLAALRVALQPARRQAPVAPSPGLSRAV